MCVFGAAALDRTETLQAGILSLSHRVVKVELGCKVPLAVVRMLTANIICVESYQGLIWGHAGRAAVQYLHGEVELNLG